MRVARIDARFDPTIYIAIGAANLLAIGGGSWMVIHGSLTLGQLTSFVMYLGLMIWPMLALAWMFNIVERGSAAYGRIRTMLEEAPAVDDGTEAVPAGRGVLQVAIRDFIYPQASKPSLEQVNFTLQPGQMLGICGPTGAGKSTILALLQRHFDVTHGEIRFHDLPLPILQLDSWRARLAVVNQTPFYSPIPSPIISRWENRTRRRRRLSGLLNWPACMTTFCVCLRATRPKWASAA